MTTRPWPTSCDQWGRTTGPDTDDPKCQCGCCRTRRWDRLTPKQKKVTPRP